MPEGVSDIEYLESIVGPFRRARDVPKFDSPLTEEESNDLILLIDPDSVNLENLSSKFILAKRFVLFTLNNRA